MQFFDEGQSSYIDYSGYNFLPGYSYPTDWLFEATNIFAYHNPVSIHLGSTTATCLCGCTTRPSDSEWTEVLTWQFPKLKRCQVCKTGPYSEIYNCLAWTVDDTSQWLWLQADSSGNGFITVSEMNAYLSSLGKSNIWYYGLSTSDIKHVAKKSGGMGPDCLCSSKLGPNIRISHDMAQLEGGVYGNIVGGN